MIDPREGQRAFEDVRIGDEFDHLEELPTERVRAFLDASLSQGIHRRLRDGRFFSVEDAQEAGLERPLVPGPMSTALLMRLVSGWIGPFGRVVSMDVSYRRPVLQGDRVRCVAVVTDTAPGASEDQAAGTVSLDVYLERDDGERPVQGVAVVELPRRDALVRAGRPG